MMVVEDITSIVSSFFEASILGIPIWLILGIIIFVITEFYKPKKEEKYREISLTKEVRREMNELFKVAQENLGHDKILSIGPIKVGNIVKMINYNFKKEKPLKKRGRKPKEDKDKPKLKERDGKFYGFKVIKNDFISKVKARILDTGHKFYIVEQSLCQTGPFQVTINPYSQYTNFVDVMIFSEAGKEIIKDIAYKLTLENTLESMVNYVPKLSFLELAQSKFAGKMDKMNEMQRKQYDQRLEKMMSD